MKLFIPEIGTELKLLQDWSLSLIPDRRNVALGELNQYAFQWNWEYGGPFWTRVFELGKVPQLNYSTVVYPTSDELEKECKRGMFGYGFDSDKANKMNHDAELRSPEYVQSLKEFEEWKEKMKPAMKYEKPRVTIPAGAILKVDRIYIRKGNEKFSSVSFYWKNNPTNKKLRFFAKLKHCNEMECEIVV